jgi:hypothetical protein
MKKVAIARSKGARLACNPKFRATRQATILSRKDNAEATELSADISILATSRFLLGSFYWNAIILLDNVGTRRQRLWPKRPSSRLWLDRRSCPRDAPCLIVS